MVFLAIISIVLLISVVISAITALSVDKAYNYISNFALGVSCMMYASYLTDLLAKSLRHDNNH